MRASGDDRSSGDTERTVVSPTTMFFRAVVDGNGKEVARMLADGADPNLLSGGTPPLIGAAIVGRTDVAALLLGAGADPGLSGSDGATALGTACRWGFVDMASLLIAHGADIDQVDGHGWTAEHAARESGHSQLLTLLEHARASQRQRGSHELDQRDPPDGGL